MIEVAGEAYSELLPNKMIPGTFYVNYIDVKFKSKVQSMPANQTIQIGPLSNDEIKSLEELVIIEFVADRKTTTVVNPVTFDVTDVPEFKCIKRLVRRVLNPEEENEADREYEEALLPEFITFEDTEEDGIMIFKYNTTSGELDESHEGVYYFEIGCEYDYFVAPDEPYTLWETKRGFELELVFTEAPSELPFNPTCAVDKLSVKAPIFDLTYRLAVPFLPLNVDPGYSNDQTELCSLKFELQGASNRIKDLMTLDGETGAIAIQTNKIAEYSEPYLVAKFVLIATIIDENEKEYAQVKSPFDVIFEFICEKSGNLPPQFVVPLN